MFIETVFLFKCDRFLFLESFELSCKVPKSSYQLLSKSSRMRIIIMWPQEGCHHHYILLFTLLTENRISSIFQLSE